MTTLTNLLDFDLPQLTDWVQSLGERPFRARQIFRWIHREGCNDFAAMTDVAKSLRAKLEEQAIIAAPRVLRDSVSRDGTRKWLLDVGGGNAVETVFIPERSRGTLCVSTQAGCALECAFCSTGKQGFNRNLSTAEILGQLWLANRLLGAAKAEGDWDAAEGPDNGRVVTNVVLMGMGEPLANFEAVVRALRVMLDDHGYGLSRRRVTVSTSGIVPAIDACASSARWRWRCRCMRPTMRCAIGSCRSIASIPCASCSQLASAISSARRATSSRSNMCCSPGSTTNRSTRVSWWPWCATCPANST